MITTDKHINLDNVFNKKAVTIGVLSDTHGQVNQLVRESLSGCDVILHAGDIGSASVIKELRKVTKQVYLVRGNNDIECKWASNELSELKKIPESVELTINDQIIAITHGHQFSAVATRHDRLRECFTHADIVIYGHSHRLVCDTRHSPWILNPGAGGYNRTFEGASCLVMKFTQKKWKINKIRYQNQSEH